MSKLCICNSDAYHSWYAKVQKTYCFRCSAYVDSEILTSHEEEHLPTGQLQIPDVLGLPDRSDLLWPNISVKMARQQGWYVSLLKEMRYLVLPVFRNNKMIFWTARYIGEYNDPNIPKYLSAHGSRKAYWLSDEQYPTGDLFMAESVVDACYLSQLGQSVGLMGTSYNNSLNNWLRSATRIVVCFDADVAGRVASLILAKQLRDQNICKRILILPLPDGTDPVDNKIDDLKRWISELN